MIFKEEDFIFDTENDPKNTWTMKESEKCQKIHESIKETKDGYLDWLYQKIGK